MVLIEFEPEKFLNRLEPLMATMVQFKINISEKTGKSKQKELSEEESLVLIGKKIGDKIAGDALGFTGYEFEITGGSDNAGVPMRNDIQGENRARVLAVSGVGMKKKDNGIRQRKLMAGNTIYEKTAQINVKVVKEGKDSLFEEPKPEEPAEAKDEAEAKTE